MKTRCPCCGAENSLDALLANDDARAAVWAVAQIGGEVGRLAVQYIALFRPAKTALTFERMAKLLNELLPDMQRGAIERNGVGYVAPPEAWIYGFQEMLARRHAGCLKLPLKSHGYLYEVVANWRGQAVEHGKVHQDAPDPAKQQVVSQTVSAAMKLQELRK